MRFKKKGFSCGADAGKKLIIIRDCVRAYFLKGRGIGTKENVGGGFAGLDKGWYLGCTYNKTRDPPGAELMGGKSFGGGKEGQVNVLGEGGVGNLIYKARQGEKKA